MSVTTNAGGSTELRSYQKFAHAAGGHGDATIAHMLELGRLLRYVAVEAEAAGYTLDELAEMDATQIEAGR